MVWAVGGQDTKRKTSFYALGQFPQVFPCMNLHLGGMQVSFQNILEFSITLKAGFQLQMNKTTCIVLKYNTKGQ